MVFLLAVFVATTAVAPFSPLVRTAAAVDTSGPLANASMADRAVSFAYLGALRHCIAYSTANLDKNTGAQSNRMSEDAARAGRWFKDDQYAKASYLSGSAGAESGDTQCNAVVNAATKLWGYGSPLDLYCSFMPDDRVNGSSCLTGSGPYRAAYGATPGPSMDPSNRFDTEIKNRVYGGNPATASSEQLYLIYQAAFFGGCSPRESANPNDAFAYHVTIVGADGKTQQKTYEGVKFDTGRYVYTGTDLTELNESCRTIEARMNEYAPAYSFYQGDHSSESQTPSSRTTDGSTPGEGTSSCPVSGVGWVVCPALNALGGLNDAMWGFTSALLTVSPIQQEQRDASGNCTKTGEDGACAKTIYYAVWRQLWALSNAGFAIVFLFIIFAQLLGGANLNYGVKKALPRFVVAVIAASLSFVLIQLAVDVANVAGKGIYETLDGVIRASGVSAVPSWGSAITAWATSGLAFGAAAAAIAIAPEAALMLALPAALAALLGFLAALITLIFRQAVIPILALVAPLAILAAILPNTKSWFDKWKSLFIAMLMLYPLAALLFGGVKIAAYIVNADGGTWSTLIALIVMGAPLFMLPFIARKTGPMLGTLNSTARGLLGRVEKPVKGWADGRRKAAMDYSDATPPARWNIGRRVRQGFLRRTNNRDLRAAAWREEAHSAFNQSIAEHADQLAQGLPVDGAGAAHIRAVAARAQAEEVKLAMDSMKLEAGFNPNDRKALADTLADAIRHGDNARATAATTYLVGARGVDELHTTLTAAHTAGHLTGQMATTMQRAVTSPENGGIVKERRPDITTWGAAGGDLAGITTRPGTWALSAEDAAGLSIGAMRAAHNVNGMPSEIAQRVLDTPQLRGKLDPDKEAVMLAMAGRTGPRTLGPIGSERREP